MMLIHLILVHIVPNYIDLSEFIIMNADIKYKIQAKIFDIYKHTPKIDRSSNNTDLLCKYHFFE